MNRSMQLPSGRCGERFFNVAKVPFAHIKEVMFHGYSQQARFGSVGLRWTDPQQGRTVLPATRRFPVGRE
jgi:hypothetical protein